MKEQTLTRIVEIARAVLEHDIDLPWRLNHVDNAQNVGVLALAETKVRLDLAHGVLAHALPFERDARIDERDLVFLDDDVAAALGVVRISNAAFTRVMR